MRNRSGFSLVEVVVALTLLSVAAMGAQAMAARMIRTVATANVQLTAAQLVEDRIDRVRLDPQYDSLVTKYAGTENPVTGFPMFTRTTTLVQTRDSTSAGITDYMTMTVQVSEPSLTTGVARTVVIGAP